MSKEHLGRDPNKKRRDQPVISRRAFLSLGPILASAAATDTLLNHGLFIQQILYPLDPRQNGEANSNLRLCADHIDIVEPLRYENEFIALLNQFVVNGGDHQTVNRVITNTLYRGMIACGVSQDKATVRASNVATCSPHDAHALAEVLNAQTGLGLDLKSTYTELFATEQLRLDFLNLLFHESSHLAINTVDNRPLFEDYGVLGLQHTRGRQGFTPKIENTGPLVDLSRIKLTYNTGESFVVDPIEEFYAELTGFRLRNQFELKGLKNSHTVQSAYSFFRQGIIDANDTKGNNGRMSWHSFWNELLDHEKITQYHREGKRVEYFKALGYRLIELNNQFHRNNVTTSTGNLAAMGLIGFIDFTIHDISNGHTLSSLITQPLPDNLDSFILEKVQELRVAKQAFEKKVITL